MEALLAKEEDVESWNDDRLDELSRRVDDGFKEMREGFARIDGRFDRIDDRFTKLFLAIITVGAGFAATTIATLLGALLL